MKKYNISVSLIQIFKNLYDKEVCTKIQQAIGPHEDLMSIVKRRKLKVVWTCLQFIRSGQNHLQGTVEGGRRQDRQKKRWEDNIREWIGQEIIKSQRAVEDREKWRKLVVKSSPVSPAIRV